MLPCEVQGDFGYVEWVKGALDASERVLVQRFLSDGTWKTIAFDKSGDFDMTSDFSLVVHDVGFRHVDVYVCQASILDTWDPTINQTNVIIYGKYNCY